MTTTRPASELPNDWNRFDLAEPLDPEPVPLTELARRVVAAWPLVIGLAVLGLVIMGAWLRWAAVPRYTAQMTVAPYVDLSMPDRRGSALGGLSSLIGVDTSNPTNFNLYLETRQSVALAGKLLELPEVRREIFTGQWDDRSGQWHAPQGGLAEIRAIVRSSLNLPAWSPPTAADLATFLQKGIKEESDRRNTHYTFYFDSRDPAFAASLLQHVHDEAEAILRDEAQTRTAVKIDHLIHQIAASTIAENRQALTDLLAEEQREAMLISPKIPYAAVVVDPPSVGHYPSSPRPMVDLLIAALGGAALGILIIAAHAGHSRPRRAL